MTIQDEIRETRAELARLDALDRERSKPVVPLSSEGDDWSQTPEIPEPKPALAEGDLVSFFGTTILSVGDDEVSSFRSVTTEYGMSLQLDAALLLHNATLWEMAHDPERQMAKWKRETPLYVVGPWPEDLPKFEKGSYAESVARDEARSAAFLIADEIERRKELRRIDDLYGMKSSSTHLASYRYDS